MTYWYLMLSAIILLTIIGGLPRIWLGPTRADRMLSAQLSGSASVAILLLMGAGSKLSYLYDVALIFALLAAVAVVSFVRLAWQKPNKESTSDSS